VQKEGVEEQRAEPVQEEKDENGNHDKNFDLQR